MGLADGLSGRPVGIFAFTKFSPPPAVREEGLRGEIPTWVAVPLVGISLFRGEDERWNQLF